MQEKDEDEIDDTAIRMAITEFIQDNFKPAESFQDATLSADTTELVFKLKDHFDVINVQSLYHILKDLGFKEINMPGNNLKPVWLLQAK